jgi:hypothetical protein
MAKHFFSLKHSHFFFVLRIGIRRTFKGLIYFIGITLVELGVVGLGYSVSSDKALQLRLGGIGIFLGFLILIISILIFFRWYWRVSPLGLGRYILWLLGATLGVFTALALEYGFIPNYQIEKTSNVIIMYTTFMLYGTILMVIAHMKPSLILRLDESVRKIIEATSDKQITLEDLTTTLKKEYKYSETILHQHVGKLEYLEQLVMPVTNIRLYRIKRKRKIKEFPQFQAINNPTTKANVERALADLTEERVDIGLFLLGREFETVLKAFLVAAYGKGRLISTPGGKSPEQLKLVELIACLKNNGIVTDDAALSYLRQTRNDRAHGSTPTLAERRLLMNNVQHLASLYIDYIKLFDDLTQTW